VHSKRDLALNKTKNKPKGLASTVHFITAMEIATNPWSQLFHISGQIIKLSLPNETWNVQTMVFMWRLVW